MLKLPNLDSAGISARVKYEISLNFFLEIFENLSKSFLLYFESSLCAEKLDTKCVLVRNP